MRDRHEFDAKILDGRGGGALVEVPFSVEEVYGTRGRVPIRAKIDGEPYRGSIVPMGGRHVLGVLKAIRAATGKDIGDTVHVVLERDSAPRTVQVPADLQAALHSDAEARKLFDALSYTHRKEYVRWIEEAKRVETRDRRVAKTLVMLKEGKKL